MWFLAGAALALAAADVMVKLAAGKIPDSLGMLLYGTVPFATGLAWFLADRGRGAPLNFSTAGVVSGVGVGVMFTLVTFCMYAAFRMGAPISLASPVIRMGGLVVASIAGFFIWKEPATARYMLGLGLICAGMFLVVNR